MQRRLFKFKLSDKPASLQHCKQLLRDFFILDLQADSFGMITPFDDAVRLFQEAQVAVRVNRDIFSAERTFDFF